MRKERTQLIRREDDALAEASLVGGLKPEDLELIERVWSVRRLEMMRNLQSLGVARSQWPQSLHWNWATKAPLLRFLGHHGWAVECEDEYQGAMLVDLDHHFAELESTPRLPVLYIDYIEAAPWNWNCPPIGQLKVYQGVGQVLFQRAVIQSHEEGFMGRVGLHALPGAERFYEQVCGMTRLGSGQAKDGLAYFELSREAAAKHLKSEE